MSEQLTRAGVSHLLSMEDSQVEKANLVSRLYQKSQISFEIWSEFMDEIIEATKILEMNPTPSHAPKRYDCKLDRGMVNTEFGLWVRVADYELVKKQRDELLGAATDLMNGKASNRDVAFARLDKAIKSAEEGQ